jgi:hypothetical protein
MIDFGPLFSQLFSTLWWLLPLLVIAAIFKQLNNSCLTLPCVSSEQPL